MLRAIETRQVIRSENQSHNLDLRYIALLQLQASNASLTQLLNGPAAQLQLPNTINNPEEEGEEEEALGSVSCPKNPWTLHDRRRPRHLRWGLKTPPAVPRFLGCLLSPLGDSPDWHLCFDRCPPKSACSVRSCGAPCEPRTRTPQRRCFCRRRSTAGFDRRGWF